MISFIFYCLHTMSILKMSLEQQQNHLKKVIRSLSQVSNVDTKDVRSNVRLTMNSKNVHRNKYRVEHDKLLKKEKKDKVTALIQAQRIFDKRSNKIESLKEKIIESQASTKKVNFQFRKLKRQRENIARKHHLSQERYKSSTKLQVPSVDLDKIRKKHLSQIFQKGTLTTLQKQKSQDQVVQRLKSTVNSSRRHLRTMSSGPASNESDTHRGILDLSSRTNNEKSPIKVSQFCFLTQNSQIPEDPKQNGFTKTQTLLVSPPKTPQKRSSLINLMEISAIRSKNQYQRPDERRTLKQSQQYKAIEQTIHSLKKVIDKDNKFKESVVFGGLKKLLYGDRRGRFIQDNAFKTRLAGECSKHYLNILKTQEGILNDFEGSYISRRNMAERFSNILGKLNKSEAAIQKEAFFA